nr:hypothetical protein [Quadrisphaera sp. INWT6]
MSATFPLGPFAPHASNPVLGPRGTTWESGSVYNPAALVVEGFEGADGQEVVLLYRAHADDVVSHVGLARSRDGVTFTCDPAPVFSPVEPHEVHGVEDRASPRSTARTTSPTAPTTASGRCCASRRRPTCARGSATAWCCPS